MFGETMLHGIVSMNLAGLRFQIWEVGAYESMDINSRRTTGGFQESGFADSALDIFGLLVDFELRLCDFNIFVLAIPLGSCFGALEESQLAAWLGEKCVVSLRFP